MKQKLSLLTILAVVLGEWLMATPRSYAQLVEPTPTPATLLLPTATLVASTPTVLGDNVSFSDLGLGAKTLRGPFDELDIFFTLPADWKLTVGAELHLAVVAFFGRNTTPATPGAPVDFGGSLEIVLNNVVLDTVLLEQPGEQTISIPISEAALEAVRADHRQILNLHLNTSENCGAPEQTRVVVRETSLFVFPHETVEPPTDLRQLPYPIWQRSFLQDTAMVVIPDQPTLQELQSALAVVSGFGRMSRAELALSLLRLGDLDPTTRQSNHLIFVGKASNLPLLSEVALPASIEASKFLAESASPDDGIIQIAVSPWNDSKVVLVVGGNSDSAVVKAGQAVSTGKLRVGVQPDIALVSEVQHSSAIEAIPVDQKLLDLGYEDRIINTPDVANASYSFYLPPRQAVAEGAYLDLLFTHSTLLVYGQSVVNVSLNNKPIGSVRLSDGTAEQGNARISIPPEYVVAGNNNMIVQTALVPTASECFNPGAVKAWFTINADSLLHLPLHPQVEADSSVFDMKRLPHPFISNSFLSDLAFVLAEDDPAGWNVAVQIASKLGSDSNLQLAEFAVAYGNDVPDTVRQNRNLLIVGRASQLPIIAEVAESLPAPFQAGSDIAIVENSGVVYNVPANAGVGYVELLPAPWNNARAILTVLGNSDEAMQWLTLAMTTRILDGEISGNLAVVDDQQLISSDTRRTAESASALSTEQAAVAAANSDETNVEPAVERPWWILPLIIGSIALIVIIVGFVGVSFWKSRRSET